MATTTKAFGLSALMVAASLAQPAPLRAPLARAAPAAGAITRPPDFVLVTKKCAQISTRAGGARPPLRIEYVKRNRESCWRTGGEVICNSGDSNVQLRVNREAGPRLLLTGEGGLMMVELDWASGKFAHGITYFADDIGIAHIQCTGSVVSGAAESQVAAPAGKGQPLIE